MLFITFSYVLVGMFSPSFLILVICTFFFFSYQSSDESGSWLKIYMWFFFRPNYRQFTKVLLHKTTLPTSDSVHGQRTAVSEGIYSQGLRPLPSPSHILPHIYIPNSGTFTPRLLSLSEALGRGLFYSYPFPPTFLYLRALKIAKAFCLGAPSTDPHICADPPDPRLMCHFIPWE